MNLLRQYGKQLAVASAAIGVLLIFLSFSLPSSAAYAHIWLDGSLDPFTVRADSPFVANWLQRAGIRLFPQDSVRVSGITLPHDFKMEKADGSQLFYKPAVPVNLTIDGEGQSFFSGADTLGEALWEQGIILKQADRLQPAADTLLDRPLNVTLVRSKFITILSGTDQMKALTAASTVGAALAETGFALQDLDFAQPSAASPIPDDRTIRVVRVREEVITEETSLPFATERVSDPEMNVGEEVVLQTGENGVQSSIVRVRYEDGEETDRVILSEWVSKASITQRIAYGGNIVEQTIGDLEVYFSLNVRVTCYGWTGSTTAHGEWPAYGTIAVPPAWYSVLVGSQIYVPNYGTGTVLDTCPGCAGDNWIDVYSEDCYNNPVSYYDTAYFLSPAPAGFTGELP